MEQENKILTSSYATGRRKTSVARVWVSKGKGDFKVNNKTLDEFCKRKLHHSIILKPLTTINSEGSYDVKCTVKGGGDTGQVEAIMHGISRALASIDEEFAKTLRLHSMLTRDKRKVERKKKGKKKARKSFQFSKR